MSGLANSRASHPTRFTFVGYRFDPRRARVTFYYRDNLNHHYAEKIDFDCPEPARVDRKLLARTLDFALFVLGLDYFAAHPTDFVATKKPVSLRLATLIAAANPTIQFTPVDPRPSRPYQGTGNLILMDPIDASLALAAELTATHLPFRPLYITTGSADCPSALASLGKPLTTIRRPQSSVIAQLPAGAHHSRLPQAPINIALALVQAVFYNFNRIYLCYPADTRLADFIHYEISPDLELIWKN